MLKIVLAVVILLTAGVLMVAATKPDTFRVERAASIKAAPEKVFSLINDLRTWRTWSPWEKKDPGMKRTYSAVTSGKGATYAWEGNSEVGQGGMEITESLPSSKIAIKLDFIKPFEGHNTVVFALEPQGEMTNVTWTMQGPTPYFADRKSVV